MVKYKSHIKDCQLIVKVKLSSNERINERELEFFSKKYIRGLLKARKIKKWGAVSLEYSGPMGVSLFERLKKPVSKYDFFFLMEQIVDIVQKMNRNAMSVSKLVWDIHQVYINETTREISFIYLPLEIIPGQADILKFIDSVIYSTNPMQEQNSEYISRFVYFLKSLNVFDAEKIERFIIKEDRSIVNTIKRHYAGQSGFMTDKPRDYYAHYNLDERTELLEEEGTALLNEETEGTRLLEGEEETTLLQEEKQIYFPSLYRVLTEEKICINKPVFRIGKEQSYADYFVANNNAVSRSHADIIIRGEQCFVMDLNSKNKTFINGQPIQVQKETEIFNGDRLRLANEEFIFYCMEQE